MMRWSLPVGLAALATLAGVGGCQSKNPTEEIKYETGEVEVGNVRSSVTATGTIQPWKIVDIKSNVGGKIVELNVDLGSTVKKDQLLARIDPTDTDTAFRQADADQRAADARKAQAEANLVQERKQVEARIAASERSLESSRARLEQTTATATTQPQLTKHQISQAEASLESSQKAKLQAEKNKSQLEQQLATLVNVTNPFNVENAQNNTEQAKANMDTALAEFKRQQTLMVQGFVSKADVQTAYARYATTKANYETAFQRQSTMSREVEFSVEQMKARVAEAADRIAETDARIEQSEAALELAKTNVYLNRVREQERVAAQAAVRQSEAELEAARAQLNAIKVRQAEIITADAQIVRAQAAVSQAKTNQEFTEIRSPRDGVVLAKNVEQGTIIASSRGSIGATNAMLQIGDVSKLWIVCNVDETDIAQVSVGQDVSIKVDAYPSQEPSGKVIRIDPQAKVEQNVTLIPVTVEIDDPDVRFKPLMNAECEFIVDEAKGVVTVPNEALKEAEDIYKVQKAGPNGKPELGPDGKPKETEVRVGLAGPDRTEIREGLQAGDKVITKTIVPEKPQTNNPFNPFGGMNKGGKGGGGGGGKGGGGKGGGGGR